MKTSITLRLRSCGIIIANEAVLVQRRVGDDVWALPGGRIEPGETSEATVIRELREELGIHFILSRPVWVIENFFKHHGENYQEVGFYYLMSLPPDLSCKQLWSLRPAEAGLQVAWIALSELYRTHLRPSLLSVRLMHLPPQIEILQQRQENVVPLREN